MRGLEPPRLSAYEPKSHAAASYAIPAYFGGYWPTPAIVAFKVIRVIPHRSDTVLKVRLTQKDLLWCIFGYRRHCIAKTSGRGYPHNNKRLAAGAPSRARTCDTRINSPLLYQLSYRGIFPHLFCLSEDGQVLLTILQNRPRN